MGTYLQRDSAPPPPPPLSEPLLPLLHLKRAFSSSSPRLQYITDSTSDVLVLYFISFLPNLFIFLSFSFLTPVPQLHHNGLLQAGPQGAVIVLIWVFIHYSPSPPPTRSPPTPLPETLYHRDDALLYIPYVMLIWAAPIPADRWHCSLWP